MNKKNCFLTLLIVFGLVWPNFSLRADESWTTNQNFVGDKSITGSLTVGGSQDINFGLSGQKVIATGDVLFNASTNKIWFYLRESEFISGNSFIIKGAINSNNMNDPYTMFSIFGESKIEGAVIKFQNGGEVQIGTGEEHLAQINSLTVKINNSSSNISPTLEIESNLADPEDTRGSSLYMRPNTELRLQSAYYTPHLNVNGTLMLLNTLPHDRFDSSSLSDPGNHGTSKITGGYVTIGSQGTLDVGLNKLNVEAIHFESGSTLRVVRSSSDSGMVEASQAISVESGALLDISEDSDISVNSSN
ncbi:MAG: hypothetical protein LBV23_07640 [Deltaproteobacteria bacterium]|jgi:hypothetical protein|nr:hypothetical protein [Deltaproteobacteria bacterium]